MTKTMRLAATSAREVPNKISNQTTQFARHLLQNTFYFEGKTKGTAVRQVQVTEAAYAKHGPK